MIYEVDFPGRFNRNFDIPSGPFHFVPKYQSLLCPALCGGRGAFWEGARMGQRERIRRGDSKWWYTNFAGGIPSGKRN